MSEMHMAMPLLRNAWAIRKPSDKLAMSSDSSGKALQVLVSDPARTLHQRHAECQTRLEMGASG
eukprot:4133448-Amphidinium_carterae.1